MKRPTVEDLFDRKGRMPLIPYVVTLIAGLVAVLILLTLQQFIIYLVQSIVLLPSFIIWMLVAIPFLLIIVGFVLIILCASIRRLHDFSQSGRWSLVMLVPFINIIFLIGIAFVPSTTGPNEYGPEETDTTGSSQTPSSPNSASSTPSTTPSAVG